MKKHKETLFLKIELRFILTSMKSICRNEGKNREEAKKVVHIFMPRELDIARKQNGREDQKFTAKLAPLEIDSADYVGSIASLLSALVAGMGFVLMISAYFSFLPILYPPFSFWPIPYSATVCLFLSGSALLALRKIPSLSKFLGCLIFICCLIRIAEIFLTKKEFIPTTGMVLIATLGYMMIGLLCIFWPARGKETLSYLHLICPLFLVLLGSNQLLLYFFPLSIERAVVQKSLILHFYSALGYLCLGLSFLARLFQEHSLSDLSTSLKKKTNTHDPC